MSDVSDQQNDPAAPATPADSAAPAASQGVSILLREITKAFPGQEVPAVDGLTIEIPAGSIVMLVGPSGCGKTTTLKMINRLIEPDTGSIVMDDEDITTMNVDRLRRRMGYVVQAGGLFPHMSVAANVGIVPKMLGWDKSRIAERVDELLDLVSLDPGTYRGRYPKELSGGQQQRVGVARALAADPPVLLMDEPFGAVDPITRQRLQDELLSIQAELNKTIVCVTHDFDEAVKLGDWIAIFTDGAQLAQYDSPERILADPADEFVENFIGSGSGLKQLTLRRVEDVPLVQWQTCSIEDSPAAALEQMRSSRAAKADSSARAAGADGSARAAGADSSAGASAATTGPPPGAAMIVLDARSRPVHWYTERQLERLEEFPAQPDPALPVVGERASLHDALDTMLQGSTSNAIVTGARDRYLGVIPVAAVLETITSAQQTGTPTAPAPRGENAPRGQGPA